MCRAGMLGKKNERQQVQRTLPGRYRASEAPSAHPDARNQAPAAEGHSAVVAGRVEDEASAMRGANQSTDTKYATSIICDALVLIETGRIASAREAIIHALCLLPSINDPEQCKAERHRKSKGRGFHA